MLAREWLIARCDTGYNEMPPLANSKQLDSCNVTARSTVQK